MECCDLSSYKGNGSRRFALDAMNKKDERKTDLFADDADSDMNRKTQAKLPATEESSKIKEAGKRAKDEGKEQGKEKKKRKSPAVPWKKPPGMPKRPLSAYNLFFQRERELLIEQGVLGKRSASEAKLGDSPMGSDDEGGEVDDEAKEESKVSVGKRERKRKSIGFSNLAKTIAKKWQTLDAESKAPFEEIASKEKERYDVAVAKWREEQKEKTKPPAAANAAKKNSPDSEQSLWTSATAVGLQRLASDRSLGSFSDTSYPAEWFSSSLSGLDTSVRESAYSPLLAHHQQHQQPTQAQRHHGHGPMGGDRPTSMIYEASLMGGLESPLHEHHANQPRMMRQPSLRLGQDVSPLLPADQTHTYQPFQSSYLHVSPSIPTLGDQHQEPGDHVHRTQLLQHPQLYTPTNPNIASSTSMPSLAPFSSQMPLPTSHLEPRMQSRSRMTHDVGNPFDYYHRPPVETHTSVRQQEYISERLGPSSSSSTFDIPTPLAMPAATHPLSFPRRPHSTTSMQRAASMSSYLISGQDEGFHYLQNHPNRRESEPSLAPISHWLSPQMSRATAETSFSHINIGRGHNLAEMDAEVGYDQASPSARHASSSQFSQFQSPQSGQPQPQLREQQHVQSQQYRQGLQEGQQPAPARQESKEASADTSMHDESVRMLSESLDEDTIEFITSLPFL